MGKREEKRREERLRLWIRPVAPISTQYLLKSGAHKRILTTLSTANATSCTYQPRNFPTTPRQQPLNHPQMRQLPTTPPPTHPLPPASPTALGEKWCPQTSSNDVINRQPPLPHTQPRPLLPQPRPTPHRTPINPITSSYPTANTRPTHPLPPHQRITQGEICPSKPQSNDIINRQHHTPTLSHIPPHPITPPTPPHPHPDPTTSH